MPRYWEVAVNLAGRIDADEWPDKLPAVRLLRNEYGTSNDTIGKAVEILVDHKYVQRVDRMGIYVSPAEQRIPLRYSTEPADPARATLEGRVASLERRNRDLESIVAELAARAGIPFQIPGSPSTA